MSRNSRFTKQHGRSAGNSFVSIPHFVLESQQWADLPPSSVKLLMELARQYRGANNGDLGATINDLAPRGWASNATFRRALSYLEDNGWIVRTRQGGRHIGCNLYAITWWPIDACGGKHQHAAETKPGHQWREKNGRPFSGPREANNWTASAIAVQKSDRKIVPFRSGQY